MRKQIELALSPKERLGLQNSARVLRDTIDQVESRLSGGVTKASSNIVNKPAPRAIPRSAWQK